MINSLEKVNIGCDNVGLYELLLVPLVGDSYKRLKIDMNLLFFLKKIIK